MRTVPLGISSELSDSDYDAKFNEEWSCCDYRDHPNEVLESIDDRLKPFGLEVVMADTGDSSYTFKIGEIL